MQVSSFLEGATNGALTVTGLAGIIYLIYIKYAPKDRSSFLIFYALSIRFIAS
jgi:hypothetical protein